MGSSSSHNKDTAHDDIAFYEQNELSISKKEKFMKATNSSESISTLASTTGRSHEVQLFGTKDFKKLRHKNKIHTFLVADNLIFSTGLDKVVVEWDRKTTECKRLFQGHTKPVTALLLVDNTLYTGSHDRTVRAWSLTDGTLTKTYSDNANWITCLAIVGDLLCCGGYERDINVFDLESCEKLKSLKGHTKRVESLKADPNTGILYSSSTDCTIRSWDLDSGECLRVFSCKEPVSRIDMHNGMLYAAQFQQVYCLNTETNEAEPPFVGISTFTLVDDVIIGWNRTEKRFEFWDTITRALLYTVSDPAILSTSAVSFDNGELYYVTGSSITRKKVDNFTVPSERIHFRVTESADEHSDYSDGGSTPTGRSKSNLATPVDGFPQAEVGTSSSPITIKSQSWQQNSPMPSTSSAPARMRSPISSSKAIKSASDRNSEHDTSLFRPRYLCYPELFKYYVEVLLYPATKIAKIIETLHSKGDLKRASSFDEQIDVVANLLKQTKMKGLELERNTPVVSSDRSRVHFEVLVNAEGASSSRDTRRTQQIYTKEELSKNFEERIEIFYTKLRESQGTRDVRPTVIVVRREELPYDTCKHFSLLSQSDLKKPMYIFFAGEQGLDMGGVTREFYQLLSEQILDPNNALFCRSGANLTSHPNPASAVNESHLQYFRFIGKLVGKAFYDMNIMDTHFTRAIFKMFIGKPITFQDLESVDPAMHLAMNRIMQCDDVSLMGFDFTAEENDFGRNNTYLLKPNGDKHEVTEENKHEFVELYSKWRMIESVRPQLEKMLAGLYEVIPREYFAIFDENEIELLLCGSPEIDVDDWKQHTTYEGHSEDSEIIKWFWEIISEFGTTERTKLLQFVTGTANCPSEGFEGLYPPFTVCNIHVPTSHLPIAHTCLNRIDFPVYESYEVLKQRLLQAIEYGLLGFDLT